MSIIQTHEEENKLLRAEWDRANGIIFEKDAEIERLKAAYHESQATVLKYWEQRTLDHRLITELCDALEEADTMLPYTHEEVIQRAREATK